jgi:hypothetical protein
MSIDYLPDEMNAYAKGMKLPEISEFYRGWRAACEAMQAKAQAKAPPGHIIDDQGNVRKVLGTLPVTRDGVIVMPGQKVYGDWGAPHVVTARLTDDRRNTEAPADAEFYAVYWHRDEGHAVCVGDTYSTALAEQQARRGRP